MFLLVYFLLGLFSFPFRIPVPPSPHLVQVQQVSPDSSHLHLQVVLTFLGTYLLIKFALFFSAALVREEVLALFWITLNQQLLCCSSIVPSVLTQFFLRVAMSPHWWCNLHLKLCILRNPVVRLHLHLFVEKLRSCFVALAIPYSHKPSFFWLIQFVITLNFSNKRQHSNCFTTPTLPAGVFSLIPNNPSYW